MSYIITMPHNDDCVFTSNESCDEYINTLKSKNIIFTLLANGSEVDEHFTRAFGDIHSEHAQYLSLLKDHIEEIIRRKACNLHGHQTRFSDDMTDSFHIHYQFDVKSRGEYMTEELFRDIVMGRKALLSGANSLSECYECGEQIAYYVCGFKVTTQTKCQPVGYYETDIEFPTGKLIIADCIYEIHHYIERTYSTKTENYSMRSTGSHRDFSARAARAGMYHVYVGNSCPGVYLNRPTGCITLGNDGLDDEDYETVTDPIDGEKLDSICTDLWWASLIDILVYKKLLKRIYGGRKGARLFKQTTQEKGAYDIIEVPAGKYVGTSYHHIDGYPEEGKHVMATLRKV